MKESDEPDPEAVLPDRHALFWFGVVLLVIGLMLQAGATGAVKAIKMSAKLLVSPSRHAPGGQSASASSC